MRPVTEAERHLATTRVLACAAAHSMGMPPEALLQVSQTTDSHDFADDLKQLWQVAGQLATVLLAQHELAEEKEAIERVLSDAPDRLRQPFRDACSVVQPTHVLQLG